MSPVTTTIDIIGMTCSHCVASVAEELGALDGVTGVAVELNSGGISKATISSHEQLVALQIGDAIAEAGYRLASRTE